MNRTNKHESLFGSWPAMRLVRFVKFVGSFPVGAYRVVVHRVGDRQRLVEPAALVEFFLRPPRQVSADSNQHWEIPMAEAGSIR